MKAGREKAARMDGPDGGALKRCGERIAAPAFYVNKNQHSRTRQPVGGTGNRRRALPAPRAGEGGAQ